MSDPTPKSPLPSAGAVAPPMLGKTPLPALLDLNGDGIPDYRQKWFRDLISGALFKTLARIFPKSPWALVLQQYAPEIQALIDKGAV